jgi:hypothetical protein
MKFWSEEELFQELLGRGCVQTQDHWRGGTLWISPEGEHFSVPPPRHPLGYPSPVFTEIISVNGLASIVRH